MNKCIFAAFYITLMSLLCGCGGTSTGAPTAAEARRITDEQVRSWKRKSRLSDLTADVTDLGDKWRVAYDNPAAGTGDVVRFYVEKRTGKILNFHESYPAPTGKDAIERADTFLLSIRPNRRLDIYTKQANDLGNRWRVVYQPAPASSERAFFVEIQKSDGGRVGSGLI